MHGEKEEKEKTAAVSIEESSSVQEEPLEENDISESFSSDENL